MPALPFIDPENFNAGYLTRKLHIMPKQGDRQPWVFSQDYYTEKDLIEGADLDDGTLVYDYPEQSAQEAARRGRAEEAHP